MAEKYFGYSNSLYARATRVIVNHAFINKYCLRFFSQKNFAYSYSLYPIESRRYILHEYKIFNNYWNPRSDIISYFTLFLEFNSKAFFFEECIT